MLRSRPIRVNAGQGLDKDVAWIILFFRSHSLRGGEVLMSSNVIPWRKEIEKLRQEMDRLYDSFFDWRPSRHFASDWWPAVDVSENPTEIIVYAEIPGVEAKEIEVYLEGNVLTIRGERKRELTEGGQDYYHLERSYGTFSRSVSLPSDVDHEGIKAGYHDGVLELRLPKKEKVTRKRIKVEGHV
jgi:HSP20 family protein